MKAKSINTSITFENAWMKGTPLGYVNMSLGSVGDLHITDVKKNEDGDGYFVSGTLELYYELDTSFWKLFELLARFDDLVSAAQS